MAKELKSFRPFLPIIRALCNKGLQERHINKIQALITAPDDVRDIGQQNL